MRSFQKVLIATIAFTLFSCGNVRYVRDKGKAAPAAQTTPDILKPAPTIDDDPTDTDGDGLTDKAEAEADVPTDPFTVDTDGDGLSDGAEQNTYDTDPNNPDTDNGGVNDGDEVNNGTDPLSPLDDKPAEPVSEEDKDNDNDGLTNGKEDEIGTDKENPDTDGDGLTDGQEVNSVGTDPKDPDTDDGGVNDGTEVNNGTNPVNNPDDDFPSDLDFPTKDEDFYAETCDDKAGATALVSGDGALNTASIRAFSGSLSARENYNYRSFSANPKIGPKPEQDVLYVYLYKSPEGTSLFFHANQNNASDNGFEQLDMDIIVKSANGKPRVLLAEELHQVRYVGGGKFKVRMNYFKNSDGGVIGYLGDDFDISIDIKKSTQVERVIIASNDGGNKSISGFETSIDKSGSQTLRITGCGMDEAGKDDQDLDVDQKPEQTEEPIKDDEIVDQKPEQTEDGGKDGYDFGESFAVEGKGADEVGQKPEQTADGEGSGGFGQKPEQTESIKDDVEVDQKPEQTEPIKDDVEVDQKPEQIADGGGSGDVGQKPEQTESVKDDVEVDQKPEQTADGEGSGDFGQKPEQTESIKDDVEVDQKPEQTESIKDDVEVDQKPEQTESIKDDVEVDQKPEQVEEAKDPEKGDEEEFWETLKPGN